MRLCPASISVAVLESDVREKVLILAYDSRLQSVIAVKTRQELQTISHIHSHEQRENKYTHAHCSAHFLYSATQDSDLGNHADHF